MVKGAADGMGEKVFVLLQPSCGRISKKQIADPRDSPKQKQLILLYVSTGETCKGWVKKMEHGNEPVSTGNLPNNTLTWAGTLGEKIRPGGVLFGRGV